MSSRRVWLFQAVLVGAFLFVAGCSSTPADSEMMGQKDPPCSCTTGERRCEGSSVQICEQEMPGCASWGPPVACPSGTCEAGACTGVNCQDACPAGTSRCGSSTTLEVCRLGASGCLEWVAESCGSDFCDPAQSRCVSSLPCEAGCPGGYTCSRGGVCVGGNPTMLVLDVKTVQLSGKLMLNGADPANGPDCAARPGEHKARVTLTDAARGHELSLPLTCEGPDFSFSGRVFPGTYRVTVQGLSYSNYKFSNLPLTPYLAEGALAIAGDLTGKVFDVKTVQLSGKVTLNGADPVNGPDCAPRPGEQKARVTLTDDSRGYTFYLPMSCAETGFTFSGSIYPGTYRVTVEGLSYGGYKFSNLPLQSFLAASRLQLP